MQKRSNMESANPMVRKYVFILLVFCANAFGQESQSNFFEHDFARNPLAETKAEAGSSSFEQEQQIGKLPSSQNEKGSKDSSPDKPKAFADIDTFTETLRDSPGEKVSWIGLVIATNQKQKTELALKSLRKITRRHDLRVGQLYFIGFKNLLFEDRNLLIEFGLRGASINVDGEVPSNLPIKNSPTWIISTQKGETLLEGILDPTLFFNKEGHYIGNPSAEDIPAKETTKSAS